MSTFTAQRDGSQPVHANDVGVDNSTPSEPIFAADSISPLAIGAVGVQLYPANGTWTTNHAVASTITGGQITFSHEGTRKCRVSFQCNIRSGTQPAAYNAGAFCWVDGAQAAGTNQLVLGGYTSSASAVNDHHVSWITDLTPDSVLEVRVVNFTAAILNVRNLAISVFPVD